MNTPMNAREIHLNARELIGLIELENGLLDSREAARLEETQDRKQALIGRFAEGVAILQKGGIAVTAEERRQLVEDGKQLNNLMTEHARRVAHMKSVTEGLIHNVASHAEKKTAPADGYGANGHTQAATLARNAYRRPTALSVNRMV